MKTMLKALAVGMCLSLVIAVAGASAATYKVGLVTDIGGLNDKGFNHLADVGVLKAAKDLHVQVKVLTSTSDADYVPNMTTLAQQGYNLVIPVGILMTDAVTQVAQQFPKTKFAIVDVDATSFVGTNKKPLKLKNVEGILFREQQAGYLAGYLAGLYSKSKGYKAVSSVGGVKIPSVDRYIAGYIAGAKKADPGITELNAYSQSFTDQAKCKEVALNQIAKGSKVVFQVAGGCGLGALTAAKQKGLQGIGVDADQGFLGSYILTSAEKKVDQGVYSAIQKAMAGKFVGAGNLINSIQNGGVGVGKIGPAGKPFAAQVAAIAAQIKAGKITGIPTTVK